MCCIYTALIFFGPRFGILLWWLADPMRFAIAFGDNWVLPLLCFIFLPWTFLMYVLVAPVGVVDPSLPTVSIQGIDWVLLALAFLSDLVAYSGGAYGNRRQIYEYLPASQPGKTSEYAPYYRRYSQPWYGDPLVPPATPPAPPPDDKGEGD